VKLVSYISASLLSFTVAAFAADATSRPNILYFYVDDMGWGAIGPNGQAERKARGLPYVLTPNLDRLAAEGVNFTRSYGCTVCSPARSSQQTGFHQGHTFADRNDPDNAKKAIRADDLTMGEMLASAGYTTGYWGKWGYGGSKGQENPTIDNIQTLPTSHGYRHVVAELHHVRAHTFYQPTLWTAPASEGAIGGLDLKPNSMARYRDNKNYPDEPALQNHKDYPETAYCDDVYAFAALDFVRKGAREYHASGKPFFGLLAVQVPHAPFDEIERLPEWDRAYRNKPFFKQLSRQAKQWAAMVTRIDAHFGNILNALEDPNGDGDRSDSVADNTLVIFQSDNGGPQHPARNEFHANGGLRAAKGKIEEGGIRIPTIMRWPAKMTSTSKLRAGTSTDQVIDVTDLLPTFCELARVPAPLGVDGVSLAPTLTGEGLQRKREFLIHEAGNGQSIIRGNHKLIRRKRGFELYDLAADRAEENNIAEAHPELVNELRSLLIGERVAEPRGFAATYHHWTGQLTRRTSRPEDWTDYVYANAGKTYMKDNGAPRLSWIATIANKESKPNVALADKTMEVLALEIRGGYSPRSEQELRLAKGVDLSGRNEIRLTGRAKLSVNGGSVSSLRRLEIGPHATLQGTGAINADVRSQGSIATHAGFHVVGDYQESDSAQLHVILGKNTKTGLHVTGDALLAGKLTVIEGPGSEKDGANARTILTARSISGRFQNDRIQLGGIYYSITYTDGSVSLVKL